MSKNQNLKLNNLKINTNIENLYESKSPIANIKKAQLNTTSPKKNCYYSNTNLVPYFLLNNNTSLLNPKASNDDKNSANNMKLRSNSKNGFQSVFQVGQSNQNKNQNSHNENSNINKHINGQTSQNIVTKAKTEIDLEGKYYPISNTFSPKTPKTNCLNSSKNLLQNNSKFLPLSTRSNVTHSSAFTNMNSTKNIREITLQNLMNSSSNYNSNGPVDENKTEVINVMNLLRSQNNSPITLKNLNASIPNFECSKFSVKSMTVIKAYAANTHHGIIR